MILSSIAWRNIGRNRKRSLIVMTAVAIGVAAGVFACGLIIGWSNQRIDAVIHVEQGHINLFHPEFLNNEDIEKSIPESNDVLQFLEQQPEIKAIAKRYLVSALASTPYGTTSLMLNGVDPEIEMLVSELHTKTINPESVYLNPLDENTIFISEKTAEDLRIKCYVLDEAALDSLHALGIPENLIVRLIPFAGKRFNTLKQFQRSLQTVFSQKELSRYGAHLSTAALRYRLRSKIVFTITDKNGALVNETFRVCGIFKTDNAAFDRKNAFVPAKNLYPICGLQKNEIHEIVILLDEHSQLSSVQNSIKKAYPKLGVYNWKALVPDAGMMSDYMSLFNYIILGFILFALAFGIINTMLMSVLERTKELGMLMAIGMSRKKIFGMIVLETTYLSLSGASIGMFIGWVVIFITGKTGLHFESVGEGFEAIGWSSSVYPSITPDYFFGISLMVVVVSILSSIAPAIKALRLRPIEALKSDN